MIVYGSRYVTADVISISTETGVPGINTVLDRKHYKIEDLENTGWNFRKVLQGTELDRLAFKISGRENLWFLIADVNDILDPFEELGAGDELIVPSKQSFEKIISELNKST